MPGTPAPELPDDAQWEEWLYLGQRVGGSGKPAIVWCPQATLDDLTARGGSAHEIQQAGLWYAGKDKYVLGGWYRVAVARKPEGGVSYWAGKPAPQYLRPHDVAEHRAYWSAQQHIAQAKLAELARERRARSSGADPLNAALAPIQHLASKLRTRADKDAFAALVLRAIYDAQQGSLYPWRMEDADESWRLRP